MRQPILPPSSSISVCRTALLVAEATGHSPELAAVGPFRLQLRDLMAFFVAAIETVFETIANAIALEPGPGLLLAAPAGIVMAQSSVLDEAIAFPSGLQEMNGVGPRTDATLRSRPGVDPMTSNGARALVEHGSMTFSPRAVSMT